MKTFAVVVSWLDFAEGPERLINDPDKVQLEGASDLEVTMLWSLAGAGCWLARVTRPNLAFEVSICQHDIANVALGELRVAN